MAIGHHGLVLGVGPDGSWCVIEAGAVRAPATGRNLMMLLPLLERPCAQVSAEVTDQVPGAFPGRMWDELLGHALGWPTDYWPGLALAWVEDGYPVERVQGAVAAFGADRRRAQPVRARVAALRAPLRMTSTGGQVRSRTARNGRNSWVSGPMASA